MLSSEKLINTFEYPEGVTRVYENGLVESSIHEDAYIDVPYLLEGKRQLEQLSGGNKYYVLSEGAGFFRISQEARELSASRDYSSHMAAVAVITTHFSTRLVFDLYHKINKPHIPTKAFTTRESALAWLEQMMQKNGPVQAKGERLP